MELAGVIGLPLMLEAVGTGPSTELSFHSPAHTTTNWAISIFETRWTELRRKLRLGCRVGTAGPAPRLCLIGQAEGVVAGLNLGKLAAGTWGTALRSRRHSTPAARAAATQGHGFRSANVLSIDELHIAWYSRRLFRAARHQG
jgi:hypothetical protein